MQEPYIWIYLGMFIGFLTYPGTWDGISKTISFNLRSSRPSVVKFLAPGFSGSKWLYAPPCQPGLRVEPGG